MRMPVFNKIDLGRCFFFNVTVDFYGCLIFDNNTGNRLRLLKPDFLYTSTKTVNGRTEVVIAHMAGPYTTMITVSSQFGAGFSGPGFSTNLYTQTIDIYPIIRRPTSAATAAYVLADFVVLVSPGSVLIAGCANLIRNLTIGGNLEVGSQTSTLLTTQNFPISSITNATLPQRLWTKIYDYQNGFTNWTIPINNNWFLNGGVPTLSDQTGYYTLNQILALAGAPNFGDPEIQYFVETAMEIIISAPTDNVDYTFVVATNRGNNFYNQGGTFIYRSAGPEGARFAAFGTYSDVAATLATWISQYESLRFFVEGAGAAIPVGWNAQISLSNIRITYWKNV